MVRPPRRPTGAWRTWREAAGDALYGPGGFYARGEAPADHFRTSVHASPLLAEGLLALARSAGLRGVVDLGSGRGELLRALHALDPDLTLLGVDVVARPEGLPDAAGWAGAVPEGMDGVLLVAHEWLDDVPVDVVTGTRAGPRLVLVDRAGQERTGPPPDPADAAWLRRWWPDAQDAGGAGGAGSGFGRAEVGRSRDEAWAGALGRLRRGVAVAVDYCHTRETRPPGGTLTGYRGGRAVPPVPDGSCDLTAHVALDACAAAAESAGAGPGVLLTQREALRRLGVAAVTPPSRDLATRDPVAYLRALERAGQAAELTDPAGLGGFGWLVQPVGMRVTLPSPP